MTVLDDAWQQLGLLDDLAVGDKKEVTLSSGKIVLILRSEGGVYACCADCPHQHTPLAEGMLEGNILTCPLHYWQWNIETGENIGVAEEPLEIFKLRQENGEWYIRA